MDQTFKETGATGTRIQRAAAPVGTNESGSVGEPASVEQDTEQSYFERGLETGGDILEWGKETIVDTGRSAVEFGESMVVSIRGKAVEVASGVWNGMQSLAEELGGDLQWSDGTLILTVSDKSIPVPVPSVDVNVPKIGMSLPFFRGGVSVGMLSLQGTANLLTELDPALRWDADNPILDQFRLAIEPLSATVSSIARITLPTRLEVEAGLFAGLGGSLRAILVIPSKPPIPIVFPSVGLRGGFGGHGTGVTQSDLTLERSTTRSVGNADLDIAAHTDTDIEGTIGLSGWEGITVEGIELCRQFWPLWTKRLDMSVTAGGGVSISAGIGGFEVVPSLSAPQLTDFNVSDLPEDAEEELIPGDCWGCELFRKKNWFASKSDIEKYYLRPKDRLYDPLPVYPSDPSTLPRGSIWGRPESSGATGSVAKCRGACGPDCRSCDREEQAHFEERNGSVTRVDSPSASSWTYHGFYTCPVHDACLEHDACFDWAANEKGEVGWFSMVQGYHNLCSLKCYCDYSATRCFGFIFGKGGETNMFFAEDISRPDPADEPSGPTGPGSAERVPYEGQVAGYVVERTTAISEGPGPIFHPSDPSDDSEHPAETFSGSRYATIVLTEPVTLYRTWTPDDPGSFEWGTWWSLEKPSSAFQARSESAILPEWQRGTHVTIAKAPAGTQIHIGEVSYRSPVYPGGTSQVVISSIQPLWNEDVGADMPARGGLMERILIKKGTEELITDYPTPVSPGDQ